MIDLGKLIALINEGFSAKQIATKFDCSPMTIYKWQKKLPPELSRKLKENGERNMKNNYRRFNNGVIK